MSAPPSSDDIRESIEVLREELHRARTPKPLNAEPGTPEAIEEVRVFEAEQAAFRVQRDIDARSAADREARSTPMYVLLHAMALDLRAVRAALDARA